MGGCLDSWGNIFRFTSLPHTIYFLTKLSRLKTTIQTLSNHHPSSTTSTKTTMPPFPLLFTLPPSSRHEILLIDASAPPPLKSLNQQILAAVKGSPNCAEFMDKYKKAGEEGITQLRVHWAEAGRDRRVWPEWTVVTGENWGAVVMLLEKGVGRDVLEVQVGGAE